MIRRRPSRARRIAKWAGLVICVLVGLAWTINYWWGFGHVHWSRGRSWTTGVESGLLILVTGPVNNPHNDDLPGWFVLANDVGYHWIPRRFTGRFGTGVWLPLWMIVLGAGVPTAWLWMRDRRSVRPGHCPCGYDLAGLAPGAACPECGRRAVP